MTNPVTYNCPHCRRPFSVVPTAQSQVVSCPSCRGQVTVGPAQPSAPPPMQAPVPPPPQPQAQRPPPQQPMQPQYQQQPMQPQYQQQPYQQQYQQPMAPQPTPPPKKSKKGLVIGVVVVVAILVVAMLAYLFVFAGEEGPKTYSATYEEFLNDLEVDISSMTMNFKTYNEGDIVDVTGTVENVRLANVPAGSGVDAGTWTLIYFEPPSPAAIVTYDCFAYKGDLSDDYTIGEEGTVKVHIKKMSAMGITMEYPDECMTSDTVEEFIIIPNITLTFTQTSPGNYTGSVTSTSDIARLEDIEIEIYDFSASSRGYGDWDLTDDDPETVDTYWGDLELEFRDVNNDDLLDPGDTFKLSFAESGDEVELVDAVAYDPDTYEQLTITKFTVS